MTLNPILRRVLIEMDKVEKVSKGGIYLVDDTTTAEQRGEFKATVLALGDLCFRDLYAHCDVNFEKDLVKVGDRVLFKSYSGANTSDDPEDRQVIINDVDILAVIEEDEDATGNR